MNRMNATLDNEVQTWIRLSWAYPERLLKVQQFAKVVEGPGGEGRHQQTAFISCHEEVWATWSRVEQQ